MKEYHVSVRSLVEFLARSGDLDETGGSFDLDAMRKGSQLHLRIQKSQGAGYQAEVTLKDTILRDQAVLQLEGRADGIFEEDGLTWIDEIKGIKADPALLSGPLAVHRAQALCYAAVILTKRGLKRIGIQLTYGNLDTQELRRFREELDEDQLLSWYHGLIDEYFRWILYREECTSRRDASMQGLEFPFPYREGQRRIVTGAFVALKEGRQLFVQAPTGTGKTLSAVFPAVRALGEGYGQMIFYLTAKTVTRTAALEAFRILRERGLKIRVALLTAKEKICLSPEGRCNPLDCPYAKGHFDRVNEAVFALWHEREIYDRDTVLEYAVRYRVCPFEMSLDLSCWVDAVICDYNYVFAPDVRLKRFFGEGTEGEYLVLIDEAHNLLERGREMYSASICREDFMQGRRFVKDRDRKMEKCLDKVCRLLLELKKQLFCSLENRSPASGLKYMELDGISPTLEIALNAVRGEMEKRMEERDQFLFSDAKRMGLQKWPSEHSMSVQNLIVRGEDPQQIETLLDLYFQIRRFLNILEQMDENYFIYACIDEKENFRLSLSCANPAKNLAGCLEKSRGAVFFSATLYPLPYYRKLLSVREDDYGMYLPSPFPGQNRIVVAVSDVSSRYQRRNETEYRKIASCIAGTVSAKAGNYLVFFPSFRMLEDVRLIFEEEYPFPGTRTIVQEASMTETQRESFLKEFEPGADSRTKTLIGFAVLGGIFSEGIDLHGSRLIGVIIVGTGLDKVSSGGEMLKTFYDRKGLDGFSYAYRNPGMNKVLQACGRVIRTESDRGVMVLLDDRFLQSSYRKLFPPEWNDMKICRSRELPGILSRFWETV